VTGVQTCALPICGNTLNPIPGLILEGSIAGGALGSSVASAGDLDVDGFSDVMLGAELVSNTAGKVELHYGVGDGISRQASWFMDGQGGYGFQTKLLGDLNGDGYSDVAVSSPSITLSGGSNEGQVEVYYGASQGLPSLSSSWSLASGVSNARFGFSIAAAGDVNGDGYDDMIIGAYSFNDNAPTVTTLNGRAFVFHGSATGLVNTATLPTTPQELINLADWSVGSTVAGAKLGHVVKGVGDLNGDGYADVALTHLESSGSVEVYYGSANGLNSSGFSWRLDAPNAGTSGQTISVNAAGDVNNDGFDDLLVRTLTNFNATIYVFYGAATGLEADAVSLTTTPAAVSAARKWQFAATTTTYATSFASAGDVNGDGYSDIIVGDPNAVNGASENLGQVTAFYGSAAGLPAQASWTMLPVTTVTTTVDGFSHGFGAAVASAGDVNQDGFTDVVIGEPTYQDTTCVLITISGLLPCRGKKSCVCILPQVPRARLPLSSIQ